MDRADLDDGFHAAAHIRAGLRSGELRIEHRAGVPVMTSTRTHINAFTQTRTNRKTTMTPAEIRSEERARVLADIRSSPGYKARKIRDRAAEVYAIRQRDTRTADVARLTDGQARDLALSMLDDDRMVAPLNGDTRAVDGLERTFRTNSDVARRAVVTSGDGYMRGFMRRIRGQSIDFRVDDDERNAWIRHDDYQRREHTRAQNEGTPADGGYAIPVMIDPSIITTSGGSPNVFLQLATVHDITTNAWKGVASAAPVWHTYAEAAASSDDSLTSISQPSIPTYSMRGVIPYSIEVGEDWVDFIPNMTTALAAGYDEILVDKFSRGTGSGEPTGIITALDAASPSVVVTSVTAGTFTDTDIQAVWNALPARWQANAVWMASTTVASQIRLHSALYHASAVGLSGVSSEIVNGKQFIEAPYFPVFSTTTGPSNRLVVGDWSQFVIARRQGINVETIPMMIDQATNRPNGTRALLAYARIGSDCPNPAAFRMQDDA